jgi:protein-L-isoaspartate O-methyltransferase
MRMKTKVVIGLLLIIAGVILSRPVIEFFTQQKPFSGQNPQDQLSSERSRIMSPDKILHLLNLQQGSIVLDLGAGYGMFSFALGRFVGPTGKVFATDVDSQVIAFLNERIRKEGTKNVIPVQVSLQGVDSFYRNQKFDVILASDVVTLMQSPETFFDVVRPSLKEGTGRLWVVNLRLDPDFTTLEFGDSGALRSALLSSGVQSAIVRRLSPATGKALAATSSTPPPEQFTSLVIEDLNKILEDPTLWPEAREKKWPLKQQDANLRDSLTQMIDQKGGFTPRAGISDDTRHLLRLLNRLIIMDLMGTDLWVKAGKLNELSKRQLEPLLKSLEPPTSSGLPPFFGKVGYEMVQEHKNIPYCGIWELKRKR